MSFQFAATIRDAGVPLRALAILAGALTLAGCDTLASMNPFDQGEKYEMKIVPDVPAEKIYDDGLGRMKSGDQEGAAKKFAQLSHQESAEMQRYEPACQIHFKGFPVAQGITPHDFQGFG